MSGNRSDNMLLALSIRVSGTVQGVGFRPYIYSLAREMGLSGNVSNTSGGVRIHVEGDAAGLFVERMKADPPPLARIASVVVEPASPLGVEGFRIATSTEGGSFTLVSPDTAPCPDCLRELAEPSDRRFGYAFINCTNCGPRYTITERVPYDRAGTTMRAFTMCAACQAEYEDPSSRRFHAVPNACPECGPRCRLLGPDGSDIKSGDPAAEAAGRILGGEIAAIKGVGGFQLACDAGNAVAVAELRQRKQRIAKPFALMADDMDLIKRHCYVSLAEERELLSASRPVVLLEKRPGCALAGELAPANRYLGFMLPSTPLHAVLFRHAPKTIMVMTSGNVSEEPILVDNAEAVQKLSGIADLFLVHDRDIFMRVDDSVLMAHGTADGFKRGFVRRARGYAPEPLELLGPGPDVLAVGADLKNTFTACKGPYAIVSQHIGDMEGLENQRFFEETLGNLCAVYRVEPVAVAHDLHPEYSSTRWALDERIFKGAKRYGCQHHWAHIASVMAEHGLVGKVVGVALDGTGYGPDGTLWGGEFLVADTIGYERAGHFSHIALPGGERAISEPWRTAVSLVQSAYGMDEALSVLEALGFYERYGPEKVRSVAGLVGKEEFSPLSSGAGRVFDAVSALLGIKGYNTFEGEAAIALEAVADEDEAGEYPVDVAFRSPMELDFTYAIICIINDIKAGVPVDTVAARFQNAVVTAVSPVAAKLAATRMLHSVVLSGGVFQNRMVLNGVRSRLLGEGLKVYTNEAVPVNDGGISLGQAYLLRERIRLEREG